MTRVALLGYGLAGRVLHRPLLLAEPGLELTHVATSDGGRVGQASADLPGATVCSLDELWTRADEYDAVVVATGGASHVPLAERALRLGKAVVVDKPLAPTAAEALALVGLGGRLTVFQNRRWDSDTLTAAALLASGRLGDVIRLESRFTRFRPQVADRWKEDPATGGGVLLDLGSHLVDQAVHLLGPAVDVYAEVDVRRAGGVADDDCFLALTHASGARSHLWCSLAAPWQGPRLVLQGAAGGWSKEGLDGTEDALRAGLPAGALLRPEPDGLLWGASGEPASAVPPAPGESRFASSLPVREQAGPQAVPPVPSVPSGPSVPADLPAPSVPSVPGVSPLPPLRSLPSLPGDWQAFYRGFAAAVTGEGPMPVDPMDAVRTLTVLAAARRSSATRTVIGLGPTTR